MTTKEKILKAAELDEGYVESYSFAVGPVGMRAENARLRPLIQAMADRLEMLEGAIQNHLKHNDCDCGNDLGETCFLHEALTTPIALDALIEGE